MKKDKLSKSAILGLLAFVSVPVLNISGAEAGFSYNSVPQNSETSVGSPDQSASDIVKSTGTVEDMLLPVPSPSAEKMLPEIPVTDAENVPVLPLKGGILPAPEKGKFVGEKVEGFGSGIPLVIALRQIVPARYAFVFSEELDLGMKTDWQGGRPWTVILGDMGEKYGFTADVTVNTVTIGSLSKKTVSENKENTSVVPPVMPEPAVSESQPVDHILPPVPADVIAENPPPVTNEPTSIIPAEKAVSDVPTPSENKEVVPVLNKKIITEKPLPVKSVSSDIPVSESLLKQSDIVIPPAHVSDAVIQEPTSSVSSEVLPESSDKASTDMNSSKIQKPAAEAGSEPFLINKEESVWTAVKGDTLRSVLQSWADTQNVSLVWNSEYDYPMQSDVSVVGDYQKAVRELLDGFSSADPRPVGRIYMNKPAGVPVLVIESNKAEK